MANSKTKPTAPAATPAFTPTFRKYKDMSASEQACFRQGAKTTENRVKENLGFKKPKD